MNAIFKGPKLCECGCGTKVRRKRNRFRKGHQAKPSISDRFWSKVQKTESCWIWIGGISTNGYGNFNPSGPKRNVRAHRFSYFLATGKDPGALLVCHKCDNPPCVRPDHLFLGTTRENAIDAQRKGRLASDLCNSGLHKMSPEDIGTRRRCRPCRLLWWRNRYATDEKFRELQKHRARINHQAKRDSRVTSG